MSVQLIERPRGTADVTPDEVYKWHFAEDAARSAAKAFGFREIRFPMFEHTELFNRGVGGTTDIVQKEMYTFEDKGGRSISLHPEGTASAVRAALENSLFSGKLPFKAYYLAPIFRYEKPEAGRLREHHQFGVECFGADAPQADAEIILLGADYLRRLGVRNYTLELNSIGCPDCRPGYHAALKAYFGKHIDDLCDTCKERLERNPLRILDCKNDTCQVVAKDAPKMREYLCSECSVHFEGVTRQLTLAGLKYTLNPRIVRGLDYYSRTVFEFISGSIGAQGTIIGGGRYDGLVEQLGGAPMPGVGFGSGIERMLLVMEAENAEANKPQAVSLYIATADVAADDLISTLINDLRKSDISVERDLMKRSLKSQLKYANALKALTTLVIGGDELASGKGTLKSMLDGSGTEVALNADAILYALAHGWENGGLPIGGAD
jgi:histidyl-tRNA synthetase